jgi:hypothetical protein
MKRTLIALALALGATAAVAEPTLEGAQNQSISRNAPEATAYQAGSQIAGHDEVVRSFNP